MENLELPIVGAPMAGGPTTPKLAAAVSSAGGLGFLAAGYRTVEQLAGDIRATRALTPRFGVNLFVPGTEPVDLETVERYRQELEPEAKRFGVKLPEIRTEDDDDWQEKLDLLTNDPVSCVSFTFGLPDAGIIRSLQKAGSTVSVTVTSAVEAKRALDAGVDALIAQGRDAGGHSATFTPARRTVGSETLQLVPAIAALSQVPVVAAGGVSDSVSLRRILDAGAVAVQIGTLLLRATEAGTRTLHRAALSNPRFDHTVMTNAFTGRPARALSNRFTDEHSATAPVAYPAIHHLTAPIRRAAAAAGDSETLNLWAGVGFRSAREASAVDIVKDIAENI